MFCAAHRRISRSRATHSAGYCRVDPRLDMFWLQGSAAIAYDIAPACVRRRLSTRNGIGRTLSDHSCSPVTSLDALALGKAKQKQWLDCLRTLASILEPVRRGQ